MNKIALETDVNSGLSSYQIAEKYKKGQTTIRYWLKRFGLKTKGFRSPTNSYHYKYEKMPWNRFQQIIDLGGTWRGLQLKGCSSKSLSWAVANGRLKLRTGSDAAKLAWKSGTHDVRKYRTPEHRKLMSRFGGIKPNAGRCEHIKYVMKSGITTDIQGSWELQFVSFLDKYNIIWGRNKVGYKYLFEGKEHLYFPDFWLKDFDVYVEVKGYETEKDRAKWKQFPFKLLIVKKQEIQDLITWWKLQNNLRVRNGTAYEAVSA